MKAIRRFIDIFRKRKTESVFSLPSYDEKRQIILTYQKNYSIDTFVETGTFLGDTVEYFKHIFSTVYSIELSKSLAERAKDRFKLEKNVFIIEGDSATHLEKVVQQLRKPALFWLDGHYSSEFFIGDEFIQTARSSKDTPIKAELSIVLKSDLPHVILIDDARLFIGKNDYPTYNQIKKMVNKNKNNYECFILSDIIHIVPKI